MSPRADVALVALDWGSSHLRAYLMGADGAVLDERFSDAGASRIAGGATGFDAALMALLAGWAPADAPLWACGMIGSAHGWQEVPYLECPATLGGLRGSCGRAALSDGRQVHIVPGLRTRNALGLPDVMRGEETQVCGLLARHPELADGATVLLPGTHSKWITLRQGRVEGFDTYITGELYAVLREHSVLGRLMAPQASADAAAFAQGVAQAGATTATALARLLFSVRTLGLMGELSTTAAPDYLSGLLVGAEVAAALPSTNVDAPLVLAGEPALCDRYADALAHCGRPVQRVQFPLAATGLWAMAQAET